VVVDLAVEYDLVPTGPRRHRLMTTRRQVDDRQSSEPEGHTIPRVDPCPGVIGPPVSQGARHAAHGGLHVPRGARATPPEAGNPAHSLSRMLRFGVPLPRVGPESLGQPVPRGLRRPKILRRALSKEQEEPVAVTRGLLGEPNRSTIDRRLRSRTPLLVRWVLHGTGRYR